MNKGRIVVIEGTDCSGKSTQFELTCKRLKEKGYVIDSDSFPNYDSNSSYFVTSYLRGEFGENAMDVNPKAASTFYALDRYASYKKRPWGNSYDLGGNILFARYLTSNILHQASKYDSWEEQKDFIDWLYEFECELLGIPKDDCVILLDMPREKGKELQKKRLEETNGLTSSGTSKDIHEENQEYLDKSYKTALKVADYLGWKVVSCVNENNEIKSIEEINDEIMKIVEEIYIK